MVWIQPHPGLSCALEQKHFTHVTHNVNATECWPDMPLFICGFTATVPPPVRMNNSFNVISLSEKWVMNSLALFHKRWWCHRPSSHGRHRHQRGEKLLDAKRCAGCGDGQVEMKQKWLDERKLLWGGDEMREREKVVLPRSEEAGR